MIKLTRIRGFSWFERQAEPETEMSPPLTVGDIEAEFFIAK
jgi:hypothetical protein